MTGAEMARSGFDAATAVHDTGEGQFDALIHDGWDIGGNANGGYLLAIAGRAMSEAVGRPPLTITAHYLAPAPAGPCRVVVETVRSGRRMATADGTLSLVAADGSTKPALRVLGTFAEQEAAAPLLVDGSPPELPSYDECIPPVHAGDDFKPALQQQLAVRLRPGDEGFRTGHPTGRAEIAGWFALPEEHPVDAIGLLLVADAFPPPIFNTTLPVAWVPTVELTVHVRGVPSPGPLACVFRSRFVQGGLLEEDGEVWDSAGRLVCQSRQISLTPRG